MLNFVSLVLVTKFLVSGLLTAVFYFSLLYFLTDVAGVWYLLSSIVAFVLSVFVNFIFQKWWTFRSLETNVIKRQVSLYAVLAIGNIFVNTVLMYIITDILGLWYIFSQIIVGTFIAIYNFLLYRFYIFNNESLSIK